MIRLRLLPAAALLLVLPVLFPVQASAQSSTDVLNRLRAAYEATDALRASFTQQVGGQTLEGTIVLSGDRYRVELPGQTLVTDGTTAWAFSHADNQVLVNDVTDDGMGFTPSTFFTTYPEQFRARVTGSESLHGARHDVVQLTPHSGNEFVREVTLYVRAADSLPTRIRLIDAHGTALIFQLHDVERNPRLAAGTFTFQTPPGAEVIDLR